MKLKRRLLKLKKKWNKLLKDSRKRVNRNIKNIKDILKASLLGFLLAVSFLSAEPAYKNFIINKVGSNTVYITNPVGAKYQGSATGFQIIAPSGKVYTITNAHVCELGKDSIVLVEEKRHSNRLIPKRIIEVYQDNDLCLVEGLEGYEGLSLADSYSIGDLNLAIGYPLGEALNITFGFLKEVANIALIASEIPLDKCVGKYMKPDVIDTFIGPIRVCTIIRKGLQTNIPIYPGNSGSPMVNLFGNVTGIIFASNGLTAWGSAVPLEDVREFLKPY